MKCKHCNGNGKEMYFNGRYYIQITCRNCGGKGIVTQTNEEWFCQLSTEEKAEWLEEKMTWAAQEQGTFTAKGWELWLKQPHAEKE